MAAHWRRTMMERFARPYAIVGLLLAIGCAVGTVVVRIVAPAPFIPVAFGFGGATMVGFLVAGLSWASIGALLVVRRPGNAVGWLMVLVGVGYAGSQLSVALTFAYAAEGTAHGLRLAQLAGWATVLLQLVGTFQIAIGFLFPTGRAKSRRWARFMRVFWAFAIVFVVISITQPGSLQLFTALQNPFGFGPDLRGDRPMSPILAVATVIIFVSLATSMASRYRSAGRVEHQQMKWFVLALGLSSIGLGVAVWEAIFVDHPANAIGLTIYVFAGALVPVAIGIAILRHHLYDIDRIISRTLGWTLATGVLVAVFAGVVIALQAALSGITQGETLAVAASTLVAFALFQPVRQRIQRAVDRRFDRARYDGERTAAALAERLRDQVDLVELESDVLQIVGVALRPTASGVWLRSSSRDTSRPTSP